MDPSGTACATGWSAPPPERPSSEGLESAFQAGAHEGLAVGALNRFGRCFCVAGFHFVLLGRCSGGSCCGGGGGWRSSGCIAATQTSFHEGFAFVAFQCFRFRVGIASFHFVLLRRHRCFFRGGRCGSRDGFGGFSGHRFGRWGSGRCGLGHGQRGDACQNHHRKKFFHGCKVLKEIKPKSGQMGC